MASVEAHPLRTVRFQRISRWLLGLAWLVAFTGTHIPLEEMPATGADDLTLHITGYSILTLALVGTLWAHRRGLMSRVLVTIGVLAVYGVLDELTQPYVNRHASLRDWYGDLMGVALGLLVFEVIVCPLISSMRSA